MTPDVKLLPCPFCGKQPKQSHCMAPELVRCVNDEKPHCPASFGGVSVETWNRLPTAQGGAQEGVVVPASKLLELRHALVSGSVAEAYHVLYSIASPRFDKLEPWAELEALTASQRKECGE